MRIRLGSKVKDSLTGFTGIAIARTKWLHGCARVTIQPQDLKEGKIQDSETFDETRLEVILDGDVKKFTPNPSKSTKKSTPGGPQDDATALRR